MPVSSQLLPVAIFLPILSFQQLFYLSYPESFSVLHVLSKNFLWIVLEDGTIWKGKQSGI